MSKHTPEEIRLLQVNGEMAYLWATDEDVVRAARAFLQYLNEPLDKPEDAEREVLLLKTMREAIVNADSVFERVRIPAIGYLIAAAPALLEAAKAGLACLESVYGVQFEGEDSEDEPQHTTQLLLRNAIAAAEERTA